MISGLGAMVLPGNQLRLAPAPFPVPSPVAGATQPAARFAGTPVHWLHVGGLVPVRALARGSRRVFYQQLAPGLPDGTSTAATLIEVSPLPGFLAGALRRLAGGFPVQYVLLDAADTAHVANRDDEALVAVEEQLLLPTNGYWLAVCSQDRVCRDPAAWVLALDDAAQAGGIGVTPSWSGFRDAVTMAASPRIRLLTHTGAPLPSGQFLITTGGATHNVTITPASPGDTGVDVTGGTARIAAVGAQGTPVLASSENNASALGTELALTDSDRHVLVSDTSQWFARRSAGVTRLAEWTAGNTYEPIVDGTPYFERLVPDLRSAENGDAENRGAVVLAGWAFVKEALLDQTRPWTLLPEDDSTEVVALIDELSKTAQVQLLVNQFLQMDEANLFALREDAAALLAMLVVLIGDADVLRWLMTDMAGWSLLAAGLTLIPALPKSLLRDALMGLAEASKSTVEALNVAPHPDLAVWTPYPAVLGDNPLAPHPVTVSGISIDAVDNHFGVYHVKSALIKPAGGAKHPPFCYLGGIDLSPNRVDDPLHRAVVPFHDIQVRLSGPAVNDVIQTTAERASVHGATPPAALTPPSDPNAPPLVPMPDPPGPHLVQVGRTYYAPAGGGPGPYASAPRGERTTRDTVLRAIASAREYIYIEDQYFTPSKQVLEAIVSAGHNVPDLQLMVTLVEDNGQLYGELRRDYVYAQLTDAYGDRFRVGTALRRYLDPDPGTFGGLGRMVLTDDLPIGAEEMTVGPAERCPTPQFWAFVESELVYVQSVVPNGSGTGGDQTWQQLNVVRSPAPTGAQWGAKQDKHDKGSAVLAVQIPAVYIHSKLILVDDVFASIGSTNFNRRSFEHDAEIHAFALPQALKRDPANPALRLRCQVWAEHLGLPPELGLSLLADPRSALSYFDRSWYRGSRWRSLLGALGPDETPAIGMPLAGSLFQTALGIFALAVQGAEVSELWAALVDPTSAGDPYVNPATDRGPLG
jgi:phosphatidylserine/phosphatidylglycerophosphate/cardiolipin synthase-like enzyme